MLDLNVWLIVCAIIALCMQGAQLTRLRQPIAILAVVTFTFGVCALSAEYVASQSLVSWQKLIDGQLQALQILLLLEISLACFAGLKLLPISVSCALAYGLLWFFQQGLVDASFLVQALIFAALASSIIVISFWLTKQEAIWPLLLFIILLGSIILMSATLPKHAKLPPVNWQEAGASIAVLAAVIALGVIWQKFIGYRANTKQR